MTSNRRPLTRHAKGNSKWARESKWPSLYPTWRYIWCYFQCIQTKSFVSMSVVKMLELFTRWVHWVEIQSQAAVTTSLQLYATVGPMDQRRLLWRCLEPSMVLSVHILAQESCCLCEPSRTLMNSDIQLIIHTCLHRCELHVKLHCHLNYSTHMLSYRLNMWYMHCKH